ncbi:histidine phosphatase family protein [Guptibacillus algicola]|uniref:histidine phosphatase family protein n=1 Tax=Guptibacillus algicola TaxID=225844 RepID=UPI001CD2FB28|nr:histidine phosphatase family protein [Alkalihalobacillus algicola]MCA0987441.1 histidine phosphatase family protein [Alkalihalobacillus algicola]
MIYVIRHGQTDHNKERRMQGRNGLPLNEVGIQQAEQAKHKLQHIEFDLVFSSPQERAVQTAEIATGKKAVIDDRLDVFDLGEADRYVSNEVKLANGIPDPTIYKGVEDPYHYIKRVFDFMRDLEAEYGNKRVLISGHRCTTGGIGAYFEGIPEDENILRYSSDNGDYKVYEF